MLPDGLQPPAAGEAVLLDETVIVGLEGRSISTFGATTLPVTDADDPCHLDCRTFFDLVDAELAGCYERPTREAVGRQCVVDFFHPRTVARLGTEGLATRFNRSGLVWVPPAHRLGVQFRVPETHDDAIAEALATAPFEFERTDHRGVTAPDGDVVTMLHFSVRAGAVSRADLEATLTAVAEALAV